VTKLSKPEDFANQLVKRSMSQQLGGSIVYDWSAKGLIVTLRMRQDRLGNEVLSACPIKPSRAGFRGSLGPINLHLYQALNEVDSRLPWCSGIVRVRGQPKADFLSASLNGRSCRKRAVSFAVDRSRKKSLAWHRSETSMERS
jgi:hypothetical protein